MPGEIRTVVVSGATGALGRSIVERLAARGYRVLAIARTASAVEELSQSLGVVGLPLDLTSSVQRIDEVRLGEVSAVVHAVGSAFGGGILEVEPDALLAGVDLKVNGFLRLIRAVDHGLGAGSKLIAIGGGLGFDPTPGASVPGVANAALANAVRQLSRAYAPRQVTAHLVAPGPVDTPRLRARAADEARATCEDPETVYARYASEAPLGRLVTREEVAWAVEMLLAPEAVALTGSTMFMDMGARTSIP